MRKDCKRKKDEPLHEWIERICNIFHIGDEIKEVITSISKESYIDGSNDATKAIQQ